MSFSVCYFLVITNLVPARNDVILVQFGWFNMRNACTGICRFAWTVVWVWGSSPINKEFNSSLTWSVFIFSHAYLPLKRNRGFKSSRSHLFWALLGLEAVTWLPHCWVWLCVTWQSSSKGVWNAAARRIWVTKAKHLQPQAQLCAHKRQLHLLNTHTHTEKFQSPPGAQIIFTLNNTSQSRFFMHAAR